MGSSSVKGCLEAKKHHDPGADRVYKGERRGETSRRLEVAPTFATMTILGSGCSASHGALFVLPPPDSWIARETAATHSS